MKKSEIPHIIKRMLIGTALGIIAGAVSGLLAGIIQGLITGGRTIFILGPLYVSKSSMMILLGFLMLFFGSIIGGLAGMVVGAINRARVGWLVGLLVGLLVIVLMGYNPAKDIPMTVSAAVIGLISGIVVGWRMRREHVNLLSKTGS